MGQRMFVVFQFPIADVRPFDTTTNIRLPFPDWPNPETNINPQFIHYFGRTVERRRSADPALPDEIKFCLARRAIRFKDLARHHAGLPSSRMRPMGCFRRLFCDERGLLVRVEVGFTHNRRVSKLFGLDARAVLTILKDLCDLPTSVPRIDVGLMENKLLRQGPALARLYALATVSRSSTTNAARVEMLVEAGSPIVLIELNRSEAEFPLIPDGFASIPVDKAQGANLAFGRVITRVGVVGVWILQRGTATQEHHRSLRLCLMRLHAEQETLDLLLKQIQRKRLLNPPEPTIVDKLDEYFNERTRFINRDQWGGVDQSAILEAFDASEQVTPPLTHLNLVQRYQGARRNVWKKVEEYQLRRAAVRVVNVTNINEGGTMVSKNVTINQSGIGNVANVADFMSEVTNTVTNNLEKSSSGEDVKILIKQLADQITDISSKVDPKQTQHMGTDLKNLTNEMAQPEPRRAWYEFSLKGLKEAAAALGEIAKPVIDTVSKLAPLLLGT